MKSRQGKQTQTELKVSIRQCKWQMKMVMKPKSIKLQICVPN